MGRPEFTTSRILQDGLDSLAQSARLQRVKTGRWVLVLISLWIVVSLSVVGMELIDVPYRIRRSYSAILAIGLLTAGTYTTCAICSRSTPYPAMTTGFVVYSAVLLLNLIIAAPVVIVGLPIHIVVLLFLMRATLAAKVYQRVHLRQQMGGRNVPVFQ